MLFFSENNLHTCYYLNHTHLFYPSEKIMSSDFRFSKRKNKTHVLCRIALKLLSELKNSDEMPKRAEADVQNTCQYAQTNIISLTNISRNGDGTCRPLCEGKTCTKKRKIIKRKYQTEWKITSSVFSHFKKIWTASKALF